MLEYTENKKQNFKSRQDILVGKIDSTQSLMFKTFMHLFKKNLNVNKSKSPHQKKNKKKNNNFKTYILSQHNAIILGGGKATKKMTRAFTPGFAVYLLLS